MKLEAPQVLEGYFWLLGRAEGMHGRLNISQVGKCTLELMAEFRLTRR